MRQPGRIGRFAVGLGAMVLGLGAVPAISGAVAGAAPTVTRPIPPPFRVSITETAFVPDDITVAAGQTVEFQNDASTARSVVADDTSFDSGPIPPGGRFVLAIPTATSVAIHAGGVTPALTGQINVGQLVFSGAPTDRWWGSIPANVPPAPIIDVQPRWGFDASRTRALVSFTDAATVNDANAALAASNLTIVGGFPQFRIVAVEVADSGTPGDFAALDTALATLRANPAVRAAVYEFGLSDGDSIPRPVSPDPGVGLENPPVVTDTWPIFRQPAEFSSLACWLHGREPRSRLLCFRPHSSGFARPHSGQPRSSLAGHTAVSLGLMNTGGNAGGAISPYLTPLLSDLIARQYGADMGWRLALAVAGVIVFAGGGLWLFIHPAKRVEKNAASASGNVAGVTRKADKPVSITALETFRSGPLPGGSTPGRAASSQQASGYSGRHHQVFGRT